MTLIDAFVTIDGDLYHVSGPIDTDVPDWFEIAQKDGRVTLQMKALSEEESDACASSFLKWLETFNTEDEERMLLDELMAKYPEQHEELHKYDCCPEDE